jgi:hypothetical protein
MGSSEPDPIAAIRQRLEHGVSAFSKADILQLLARLELSVSPPPHPDVEVERLKGIGLNQYGEVASPPPTPPAPDSITFDRKALRTALTVAWNRLPEEHRSPELLALIDATDLASTSRTPPQETP